MSTGTGSEMCAVHKRELVGIVLSVILLIQSLIYPLKYLKSNGGR